MNKQIEMLEKNINDLYKFYMSNLWSADVDTTLIAAITNLVSYKLDLEWRLKNEERDIKENR